MLLLLQGADAEALKAAQAEENRKSLYSIMSCMRDVRKRSDKTDNMFEPLRDTVALLTRFGITMTDVVLKQLEEGPLAWKSLKKKMFQRYFSAVGRYLAGCCSLDALQYLILCSLLGCFGCLHGASSQRALLHLKSFACCLFMLINSNTVQA